ncbi:aryl-sulfate sulfotransferase [Ferrimonas pelagia]|uniref:Arylsulfotransferase N-terminal domain-containing protein n=1 Tax=Ferrimonas pelagia TaxID=1177826 RepID=A0ABP9ETU9_9GAMM
MIKKLLLGALALLPAPLLAFSALESYIRPNPNPSVPNAAVLFVHSSQPVDLTVTLSSDRHQRRFEFTGHDGGKTPLPLVGFYPGRQHQILVEVTEQGNHESSFTLNHHYTAPRLPSDPAQFPDILIKRNASVITEPGITLFNPRRRLPVANAAQGDSKANDFNRNFGLLVAVDDRGEVIWHYQSDSRISDYQITAQGTVIYMTQDYRLVEIDPLGNVLRQWYAAHRPQGPLEGGIPVDTLTFHHSFNQLDNGNLLLLGSERRQVENYYTSETDTEAPRKTQWVMGDEALEITPEGEIVWRWRAFDHLDPFDIGYETFIGYWTRRGFPDTWCWSHANKILPLADGNALINFRHLSAVAKLDRSHENVAPLWLAGPDQPQSAFPQLAMQQGQWYWHQHSPSITPDGHLMVFDNANYQAHAFQTPTAPADTRSRIVQYRLDEDNGLLTQHWDSEIPGDPGVVSYAMGSAQTLTNTGNILAGYGFILADDDVANNDWQSFEQDNAWTRIREYSPSTPAQVAWELTLQAKSNSHDLGWSLFGARRIPDFLGIWPGSQATAAE